MEDDQGGGGRGALALSLCQMPWGIILGDI